MVQSGRDGFDGVLRWRVWFAAEARAGSSPRRATYFLARQKVGKERPLFRRPSLREGFPAMLETRGRAELTALRSVQTSVASQFLKRAAHAPCRAALLGGSKGEARNSQQPNVKAKSRSDDRLFAFAD